MRKVGIEYPSRGKMHFIELGDPPEPRSTQILIGTVYSGITNGTERHSLMGEHGWKGFFPSSHGYQHVGVVEAVGDLVKDFRVGDWVYYGQYVGHKGWHIQDVYCAGPSSDGLHLVLPLPEDVDRQMCALLGVAGVAMRGVRRFRVKGPQKVWVAGVGPIGQFAAQSARAFGAHVTVSDVNASRLSVAKELGADRVINVSEEGSEEAIKEDGPYDCIIDACGVEPLLLDIQRMGVLARRGVIGLLAVRSETRFYWGMLHPTEASIEVSCHFSLDDLKALLQFVKRGIIRIEPLVSHRVPIEQAPQIYATLRDKPGELLGVIFDWS